MSEYDVKVIGAPAAKKRSGTLRRLLGRTGHTLRMIALRPRMLMLAGLAGFVLLIGTPHVGWDYECRHPFRPGQPCKSVSYCAYYGIQGRRVAFPPRGESCRLVTFIRLDWGRIIDRVMP